MSGIVLPSPDTPSPFAIAGQALAISARSTSRLKLFLKFYAESGDVTQAAKAAGIERITHYRALKSDPHYREAFAWACRQIGEDLEYSAIQQAKDGNSTLMIALLKRFMPEEYARVSNGVEVHISLTERMEEANQRLIEMYPDDGNTTDHT